MQKDSVRYFGNSLMGLGDRLRQGAQQTVENNRADSSMRLQNRYQNMAEKRFGSEQEQAKRQVAQQNFSTALTIKANELAAKNKTKPEDEMGNAARDIYGRLTPESKRYLSDFANAFGINTNSGGVSEIPAPAVPPVGPRQPYFPPEAMQESPDSFMLKGRRRNY